MMTEFEKMIHGEVYCPLDPEIQGMQRKARKLTKEYNATEPEDYPNRIRILKELLGSCSDMTFIEPDFKCDFGRNIYLEGRAILNFDVLMLDSAPIRIGEGAFIGPRVCIYTACHDIDPVERNKPQCFAKPVTIGKNVWIGGSAVILPGVTIGDNVVIGAGAVVTKDIPDNVVVGGNPAKILRTIEERQRASHNSCRNDVMASLAQEMSKTLCSDMLFLYEHNVKKER